AGGGFYVLENLKKSTSTFDIPILILTAQQQMGLEEKVKQMGAAAFFNKPFDPKLLQTKIKEILDLGN
ncbi:MAG: diguanylate cyclase response regulator, partial [Candidatus Omnitrophica bacterium]|nr:diguanylate cyclase response regulator [Candidatus Omnitrophota bacterium]